MGGREPKRWEVEGEQRGSEFWDGGILSCWSQPRGRWRCCRSKAQHPAQRGRLCHVLNSRATRSHKPARRRIQTPVGSRLHHDHRNKQPGPGFPEVARCLCEAKTEPGGPSPSSVRSPGPEHPPAAQPHEQTRGDVPTVLRVQELGLMKTGWFCLFFFFSSSFCHTRLILLLLEKGHNLDLIYVTSSVVYNCGVLLVLPP